MCLLVGKSYFIKCILVAKLEALLQLKIFEPPFEKKRESLYMLDLSRFKFNFSYNFRAQKQKISYSKGIYIT